jgi:hypothetical protein
MKVDESKRDISFFNDEFSSALNAESTLLTPSQSISIDTGDIPPSSAKHHERRANGEGEE